MTYAILKGALSRFAASVRPSRPAARTVQSAPWKLDTEQWSLELLRRLEWRRLEELAVAWLHAEGSEPETTLVHCKAWNAYGIGIKPLLELHARMAASAAPKGMMLTSGRFTQEAKTFAAGQAIELVDGAALLSRIIALPREKSLALLRLATEGDFLTPTCPACATKMVSRQSTQGGRKFWGCRNYPRCKHMTYATANAPA